MTFGGRLSRLTRANTHKNLETKVDCCAIIVNLFIVNRMFSGVYCASHVCLHSCQATPTTCVSLCFTLYEVTKLKQMWCQMNPREADEKKKLNRVRSRARSRFSFRQFIMYSKHSNCEPKPPLYCWVILFGYAYLLLISYDTYESNCCFFFFSLHFGLVFVIKIFLRTHSCVRWPQHRHSTTHNPAKQCSQQKPTTQMKPMK